MNIPVVANGDIKTLHDVISVKERTGVNGTHFLLLSSLLKSQLGECTAKLYI